MSEQENKNKENDDLKKQSENPQEENPVEQNDTASDPNADYDDPYKGEDPFGVYEGDEFKDRQKADDSDPYAQESDDPYSDSYEESYDESYGQSYMGGSGGRDDLNGDDDDTEEEDEPEEDVEDGDDDEYDPTDPEKRMPFLDHLEELRWTIVKSLIAVILGAIVSYVFSKQIVSFLRAPAPDDMKLIFLSPTEGFMTYLKVSLFSGLVLALPVITYQFWKFIVPGLLEKEKKIVPVVALLTTLCFLIGASFAYFVIIGLGMQFLLSFQTEFLTAQIAIGKYLGFVVTLILVFGVVFELPVLSFFLTKIGILNPDFLKKNRRYGIVIIFIGAAILTPPDIVTQLALAFPLIMLYEVSIWVSRAVYNKRLEEEESE